MQRDLATKLDNRSSRRHTRLRRADGNDLNEHFYERFMDSDVVLSDSVGDTNEEPLLVNLVGTWALRPEAGTPQPVPGRRIRSDLYRPRHHGGGQRACPCSSRAGCPLHPAPAALLRPGCCALPPRPRMLQTVAHAHAGVVRLDFLPFVAIAQPWGHNPTAIHGLTDGNRVPTVSAFCIREGGSRWLN